MLPYFKFQFLHLVKLLECDNIAVNNLINTVMCDLAFTHNATGVISYKQATSIRAEMTVHTWCYTAQSCHVANKDDNRIPAVFDNISPRN